MAPDITPEHDTLPPSMDPATAGQGTAPPQSIMGILGQLGPGLIIAGSIVGSGELIGTTITGAQAGMSLLWLITIGCVIKVFAQIELGRYTMTYGETTLSSLNQLPGPKLKVRWIIWYWIFMMICGIGQLGGIVGGVGQSLAITFPLKGDYLKAVSIPSMKELMAFLELDEKRKSGAEFTEREQARIEFLELRLENAAEDGKQALAIARSILDLQNSPPEQQNKEELKQHQKELGSLLNPTTYDDVNWAIAVTAITSALLYGGSYNLIQNLSTAMVVVFTFVTIGNVIGLQFTSWAVPSSEIIGGMLFRMPETGDSTKAISMALATFGIIGVGASELVSYPYWCLEKGYAKFAGPRNESKEWGERANGWLKVMHYDAWTSMGIYTIATLAFYFTGVAVLHRLGLEPDGMRLVSTLTEAYVPIFGIYAKWLFLVGAFAVLYSTFLVANAGHSRTITDCVKLFGAVDHRDQRAHDRWIAVLGAVLPVLCMSVYLIERNPVKLIVIGAVSQAIMLPMLGFAALFFRYRRCDKRLAPSIVWDIFLILSCIGLTLAGGYSLYREVIKLIPQ